MTIPANDKTWITPKIKRLIDNRNECFKDQSSDHPKLKAQVQREIRHAKRQYASTVEQSMQSKSRMAWSNLKSLLKLKDSKQECSLDADILNVFYNRLKRLMKVLFCLILLTVMVSLRFLKFML